MAKARFPLLGMIAKKAELAMPTGRITDRWTVCEKDHVHWGQNGAAGFLFRYVPREGSRGTCCSNGQNRLIFPGPGEFPAVRYERESPLKLQPEGKFWKKSV
jgi:hypothetical protein